MKTLRHVLVAALAAALVSSVVYAAGNYSTFPRVGQASFCASTVTGISAQGGNTGQGQGTGGNSVCAQTVPAGPTNLTGNEIIPADTQLANGAPPQSVGIPMTLLGAGGAHQLVTAGSAVTVSDGVSNLIVSIGSGTTMAVTMPANPWNNQILCMGTVGSADITSFSTVANTGQSFVQGAAPTTLPVQTANTAATKTMRICYLYRLANTSWYRIQ